MLNRRTFIKTSVSAGMAVAAGSVLSGCSGLKRSDFKSLQTENRHVAGLNQEARQILYYASLAPSGHNTQPWRVRIENPVTWVVEADADRRLPIVDPLNRELMLSLGAFVENTDEVVFYGMGLIARVSEASTLV